MLLACALATLALLNFLYVMTPALVPHDLMVPAALIGSSLGAVLFALAAFVPRGQLRRPGVALAAAVTAVLITAVLAGEFTGRLPPAAVRLPDRQQVRPDLYAQPAVLALQLFMTLLYGLAAFGYLRRSQRLGDEFYGWIAIAAILAAASHLNYFLYPSLYGQWVHTGDIFRLCFYAVLLTGSIREIWSYWHALSQAAVAEERRRMARDLHDGLEQELAYLARNLDSLDADTATARSSGCGGPWSGPGLSRAGRSHARCSRRAVHRVRTWRTPWPRSRTGSTLGWILISLRSSGCRRHGRRRCYGSPAKRYQCRASQRSRPGPPGPGTRRAPGCDFGSAIAVRSRSGRRPGSGFGLVSMREPCPLGRRRMRISSVPGRAAEWRPPCDWCKPSHCGY